MARFLIILGSLLLPFAVYALWLALARRKEELRAEGKLGFWRSLPWTWLIMAGVLCMGVTLIALRLLNIDIDTLLGAP